jgi:hypothetical protein
MATRPKFAKMANYSCECVECESHFSRNDLWRMWESPCKTGWRMSANLSSPSKTGWPMSASLASTCQASYECWLKQDRSFYAQITYFICIIRSSLHSLNSPNSPNSLNSCKTHQTCLSQVWRVLAKWFGESQ